MEIFNGKFSMVISVYLLVVDWANAPGVGLSNVILHQQEWGGAYCTDKMRVRIVEGGEDVEHDVPVEHSKQRYRRLLKRPEVVAVRQKAMLLLK